MKRFYVLMFIGLIVMHMGCQKNPSGVLDSDKKRALFSYPLTMNMVTLDPARLEDLETYSVLINCCDALVAYDENNKLYPQLAEKWEILNHGKTYLFTLKKGVKFHNGQELTAEDVKWTIERNCDPAIMSPVASTFLDDIVGALERIEGRATEVKGVEVVSKYQVAFHIKEPRPYFIDKLTYPVAAPLAKGSVPRLRSIATPEELIATGPFYIEKAQEDQAVVLRRYKDYHDGAPFIEGIYRPIVKDPITRLQMFKSGNLDMLFLERRDVPSIRKDAGLSKQLHFFPKASLFYFGLHQNQCAAFKDKRVRQAIAMAINKDHIVKDVLKNINPIANSLIPPGLPGYRKKALIPEYNPKKAYELLKKAGYDGVSKVLKFELAFRSSRPDLRMVAESIALQLRQNLKINVVLNQMEYSNFQRMHTQKKLQSEHKTWINDILDPQNSVSIFYSTKGSQNKSGYSNPEVDVLCQKADSSFDANERMQCYHKAEDIILSEAGVVPLYFQNDAVLIHPRVSGIRNCVIMNLPDTKVVLKEKKDEISEHSSSGN